MDPKIAEMLRKSPYFKRKWKNHLTRATTASGERRTLTVIAKYSGDGLYYLGKIAKDGNPVTIHFPYNDVVNKASHISEKVNRNDVITYAGAAPWPNLQLNDQVLVRITCQGVRLIPFFPGKIIALPNEKDYIYEQVYGVELYTDKTVAKRRRDIVKITPGQFVKMTKELLKKHHHKRNQDQETILPPPPEPITALEGHLNPNLNPNKGDEVLARWQDDGWYYYGIVVTVPGTNNVNRKYGVMDSTGQKEKIDEKHLFSDIKRHLFMSQIKEGTHVIAEHPIFPHSYAPGQVTDMSTLRTATIQFYDGTTKETNLSYIYLTTKAQYEEDVDYINSRVMKENDNVLVRDDETGIYYKGSIVHGEVSKHLVKVKFERSGEEVIRGVEQVISLTAHTTSANRRPLKDYHYVLAPKVSTHAAYISGKVKGHRPTDLLEVVLCDKTKHTLAKLDCFYINQDFYFNAVQYYRNKEALQHYLNTKDVLKQSLELDRHLSTTSDCRTQQTLIGPGARTHEPTPQHKQAVNTLNHVQGNSRLNQTERNTNIKIQSAKSSSNQGDKTKNSSRQPNITQHSPIEQVSETGNQNPRDKLLAGSDRTQNSSRTSSDEYGPVKMRETKILTPRRWDSLEKRMSLRMSLRSSKHTTSLRESVKYTTTILKMKNNENQQTTQ